MSCSSKASAVDKEKEIDVEWEKFAQNGCPDWWLMTKYTSAWLAGLRGLPYTAFEERSLTSAASQSSPRSEVHQAQHTCDQEMQCFRSPAQSFDTAAQYPSATPTATGVAPAAARSTAGPVAAAEHGLSSAQEFSTSNATAHAPSHAPSCTAFRGLFSCQCTAQGGKGLGQAEDSK